MKNVILLSFLVMGCATANYNPMYGECRRDAAAALFRKDSDDIFYMNCLDQQNKMKAQKEYDQKIANDPDFAKKESERIKKENAERLAEQKKAEEIFKLKMNSLEPNTPMATFKKYWGEPQTQEVINGMKVFWYDDTQSPFFVAFKNGKLTSVIIDRNTIQERANAKAIAQQNFEAERRHQENLAENQKSRIQAAMLNWSNNMAEDRRRQQSEFNQSMRYNQLMLNSRKPVTTNCRNNGFGTVICESN